MIETLNGDSIEPDLTAAIGGVMDTLVTLQKFHIP